MIDNNDNNYLLKTFSRRIMFIIVLFFILFSVIVFRLFKLQILEYSKFKKMSDYQQKRVIKLPAKRGNIYDRNSELYAVSIDSYSLYVDPKMAEVSSENIIILSDFLNVERDKLFSAVNTNCSFVWIKRKMSANELLLFKKISHAGVYIAKDKAKRHYVFINPKIVVDKKNTAKMLSNVLNMDADSILLKLKKYRSFFTLKLNLSDEQVNMILSNTFYGFNTIREDKRLYVKENRASHVLGYVGIDNQGLSGVEYKYDEQMRGTDGRRIIESDSKGNMIYANTASESSSVDGKDIFLTIDNYIQYVCEKELELGVVNYKANKGYAIVMDPKNGDILAMAKYPSYNPNKFYKNKYSVLLNDMVSSVYEPGSTFKIITIASALNEGVIDEKSKISCPPFMKVGGRLIGESHYSKKNRNKIRELSVTEILKNSVNVGTVKIGMELLGYKKLYSYIKKFGFGSLTGVDLTGESAGIVRDVDNWYESDKAIITYGHAISVTPLQMINAVAAICNDGVLLKPRIVKRIAENSGMYTRTVDKEKIRTVISKETSVKIRKMMRAVVEKGTGILTDIKGYSVIGKTGTAWRISPETGEYVKGSYVTSFVGAVPQDNPDVVLLVVLDDPKNKTKYASLNAVPVFRKIMEKVIRYRSIKKG